MEPIYLGDGVYFTFNQQTGNVILTTQSHAEEEASNIIYLEPDVVIAFVKALSELPKQIKP
jgi:hypothetical protein